MLSFLEKGEGCFGREIMDGGKKAESRHRVGHAVPILSTPHISGTDTLLFWGVNSLLNMYGDFATGIQELALGLTSSVSVIESTKGAG